MRRPQQKTKKQALVHIYIYFMLKGIKLTYLIKSDVKMIVHSLLTLGDSLCTFLSTFHKTDFVIDPQTRASTVKHFCYRLLLLQRRTKL